MNFKLDRSNFELTLTQVHSPKLNFKPTQPHSKSLNFEPVWTETGQKLDPNLEKLNFKPSKNPEPITR